MSELLQPGNLYALRLSDGRWGACRVIAGEDDEVVVEILRILQAERPAPAWTAQQPPLGAPDGSPSRFVLPSRAGAEQVSHLTADALAPRVGFAKAVRGAWVIEWAELAAMILDSSKRAQGPGSPPHSS